MKDLADNTKVPSRIYYYLLDWNEQDNKQTIFNQFDKLRLCDLNLNEFKLLFDYATKCDLTCKIIANEDSGTPGGI